MVGSAQPLCLFASEIDGRRHRDTMNLRKRQKHSASWRHLRWTARPSTPRLPVAGEAFLLTSPFIERPYRRNEVLLYISGYRLEIPPETGAPSDSYYGYKTGQNSVC